MREVNLQFHRLFTKIEDKSYPHKSIGAILFILIFTMSVQSALKFTLFFFGSIKLLFTIVLLAAVIIEQWFFMMFTLFMLYLADVKHVYKEQTTGSQQHDSQIHCQLNVSDVDSSKDSSFLMIPDSATQYKSVHFEPLNDANLQEKQEVLAGVFKNPNQLNWAW